ncbi:MAG: DUF4340 domain-containing protein, partial [Bryobacterales bacterium]|nr:DUF4340 domain-containing protein [Bryobacterales bacterium]
MSKSGLWVALALLAIVGGGIGYLLYQDNQSPAPAPPSDALVFAGGLKNLTAIQIQRPAEDAIELRGVGDTNWTIVAPAAYFADPLSIGDLIGLLRTLEAQRSLDSASADLTAFGINAPMLTLTLTEGEQTQSLQIGGVNPTGGARYARLQPSGKLFLLEMASVNALSKSLGDLRQKRIVEASEYSARRIRIESPMGARELLRRENRDWTFAQPEGFFADQRLLSEFVTQLVSLRTDAASLNAASLPEARFRALPLYAQVTVATESKEESAELRGAPGAVYARSALLGGIYPVPAEIDHFLRKPFADFRDLRVFRFGFQDIFQLHFQGSALTL